MISAHAPSTHTTNISESSTQTNAASERESSCSLNTTGSSLIETHITTTSSSSVATSPLKDDTTQGNDNNELDGNFHFTKKQIRAPSLQHNLSKLSLNSTSTTNITETASTHSSVSSTESKNLGSSCKKIQLSNSTSSTDSDSNSPSHQVQINLSKSSNITQNNNVISSTKIRRPILPPVKKERTQPIKLIGLDTLSKVQPSLNSSVSSTTSTLHTVTSHSNFNDSISTNRTVSLPSSPITARASLGAFPLDPASKPSFHNLPRSNSFAFMPPVPPKQLRSPKTPLYLPSVLRKTETLTSKARGSQISTSINEVLYDTKLPNYLSPTRNHWKPDSSTSSCKKCNKSFVILVGKRRRHHCRKCGDIFCADDSSKKIFVDNNCNFVLRRGITFIQNNEISNSVGCYEVRSCDACFEDYLNFIENNSSNNDHDEGLLSGRRKSEFGLTSTVDTGGKYNVPADWDWSTF